MRAAIVGPKPAVNAMTNSAPSHLLPVFARVDLGFERGEGAWLIATNGDRYLDFTSGVAVNALGHAHPHLVKALQEQATKLWHMSNLFKSPDGEVLAARLCEQSFADFVFFCNSGAEAMEGVIKLVRHHHFSKGHGERYRIITFEGAFHGRTLGTLAATGSAKYLEGFGPPMDGFDQVPHGDIEAVKKAIGPHTAGILIEPVQGEGGVRGAPQAFFKALRALCDEHGLLLAFDEVQTGMGRTGELFAYKRTGVTPDVMSLAKALGGGFPIGAVLATAQAAAGMAPGSHGSTFGGNPLACAVARAALRVLVDEGMIENAAAQGVRFIDGLRSIRANTVREVRGRGLMLAVELHPEAGPARRYCELLREHGILAKDTHDHTIRVAPPLVITGDQVDWALEQIGAVLTQDLT